MPQMNADNLRRTGILPVGFRSMGILPMCLKVTRASSPCGLGGRGALRLVRQRDAAAPVWSDTARYARPTTRHPLLAAHYFIVLFAFALGSFLRADVTLAPLFRDGAVLQHGKPVPVWGLAEPGEKITVSFAGQTLETTAGKDGRWLVRLAPLKANDKPARLVVSGQNRLRVSDILVGEVWFCSGQSNMHWPVRSSKDAAAEIAAANNPLIRYFDARNEVADTPQFDTPGKWLPATAKNAGAFSAVAWFFAREIQPRANMPVGMIKGTLGGSRIEAWMSMKALGGTPLFGEIMERHQKNLDRYKKASADYAPKLRAWEKARDTAARAGDLFDEPRPAAPVPPSKWRDTPAGFYNSNAFPFAPYALRGFLWYQGESNAPRHAEYHILFPAMIKQWREDFQQEDAPFYFVQLANYNMPNDLTGKQWAFQREAQMSALKLPNTAMAVTIDIGEENDIHPKNKQEVGRRLALIARHRLYDRPGVDGEGPRAVAYDMKGGEIRVRLKNAQSGIVLRGERVRDLEVAGSDRKFHPADLRIEGGTLVVSSHNVPKPVAVRYLWKNAPDATLFDGDGLPVTPFRNDDWRPE